MCYWFHSEEYESRSLFGMENYFFYNFELISIFTLALYILLCDCKYEHAFDPIYAFIRSNLLSIKLKIGLFFLLVCIYTK